MVQRKNYKLINTNLSRNSYHSIIASFDASSMNEFYFR